MRVYSKAQSGSVSVVLVTGESKFDYHHLLKEKQNLFYVKNAPTGSVILTMARVEDQKRLSANTPPQMHLLLCMSPESQHKHKQQQKCCHDADQRKLHKYEHTEVSLDGEQHDKMSVIVTITERKYSDEWRSYLVNIY